MQLYNRKPGQVCPAGKRLSAPGFETISLFLFSIFFFLCPVIPDLGGIRNVGIPKVNFHDRLRGNWACPASKKNCGGVVYVDFQGEWAHFDFKQVNCDFRLGGIRTSPGFR